MIRKQRLYKCAPEGSSFHEEHGADSENVKILRVELSSNNILWYTRGRHVHLACIVVPILEDYDMEPLLFIYQRFETLLTQPKPDAPNRRDSIMEKVPMSWRSYWLNCQQRRQRSQQILSRLHYRRLWKSNNGTKEAPSQASAILRKRVNKRLLPVLILAWV